MGTDEAALDAVVAADVELMALREEEADIQSRLNAVSLDDAPQASASAANDADNDRLAEIYERLAVGFLTYLHADTALQPQMCSQFNLTCMGMMATKSSSPFGNVCSCLGMSGHHCWS